MVAGNRAPTPPFIIEKDDPQVKGLAHGFTFLGGTPQTILGPATLVPTNGPTVITTPWASRAYRFAENSTNVLRSAAAVPYSAHISCAVRLRRHSDALGVAFKTIATHHTTDGDASDWDIYFDDDNKLHLDIPWVAGDVLIGNTAVTNTADIITVGFKRSGGTGSWNWEIFLDGISDGSVSGDTNNPNTSAHNLNIGSLSGTSAAHGGGADVLDCFIWNFSIPDAVFATHANPASRFDLYEQLRRNFFVPVTAAVGNPMAGSLGSMGVGW